MLREAGFRRRLQRLESDAVFLVITDGSDGDDEGGSGDGAETAGEGDEAVDKSDETADESLESEEVAR